MNLFEKHRVEVIHRRVKWHQSTYIENDDEWWEWFNRINHTVDQSL